MIYVIRNTTVYGPYEEYVVARFVEEGKLLLHDKARDALTGKPATVEELLHAAGYYPRVKNKGTIGEQLAYMGREFIWPGFKVGETDYTGDRRLAILSIVGLSLSALMLFPIGGYVAFYVISLYFSMVWGIFFYYFFRTRQVNIRTTVMTFFLTQVMVFIIFGGLHRLNVFYAFTHLAFPMSIVGYILGVGLTEELVKMLPLLYLVRKAREPLLPQTLVYYGLMTGIAFGVFEGVMYQTQVNVQADYATAFVLNIARLTSLPFLHALWCGICGYFVAYANLYPRYRHSLYLLALLIPATLHGLYDSFTAVAYIVSLAIAFVSVVLLIAYLRYTSGLQQKLRN